MECAPKLRAPSLNLEASSPGRLSKAWICICGVSIPGISNHVALIGDEFLHAFASLSQVPETLSPSSLQRRQISHILPRPVLSMGHNVALFSKMYLLIMLYVCKSPLKSIGIPRDGSEC